MRQQRTQARLPTPAEVAQPSGLDVAALRSIVDDTGDPISDAMAVLAVATHAESHLAADWHAGSIRPVVARVWAAWYDYAVCGDFAGTGDAETTLEELAAPPLARVGAQGRRAARLLTDLDNAIAIHPADHVTCAIIHLREGESTMSTTELESYLDAPTRDILAVLTDSCLSYDVAYGMLRGHPHRTPGHLLADQLVPHLMAGSACAARLLAQVRSDHA